MTKEEQIINDPNLAPYVDKNRCWIHEAFMDGVRWADRAMIEKACEWLKETFTDTSHNSGRGYFSRIETGDFDSMEEMVENFRKAMEDEP